MRIGEALALTWNDVDLAARPVHVGRTIAPQADGSRAPVERPKTEHERRLLSLGQPTIDALAQWLANQDVRRQELGIYWIERGLIFDRHDGDMVHATVCRDHFDRAVAACKLPEDSAPHVLRHMGATLAVAAGVPLHAVM